MPTVAATAPKISEFFRQSRVSLRISAPHWFIVKLPASSSDLPTSTLKEVTRIVAKGTATAMTANSAVAAA